MSTLRVARLDSRWISDVRWFGVAVFTAHGAAFNLVLIAAAVDKPLLIHLVAWHVSALAHAALLALYIAGSDVLDRWTGRARQWPWERSK